MHAFYHNQDPKLSRSFVTENILLEKKGIEPHISKKKRYTSQLCYCSEKISLFFVAAITWLKTKYIFLSLFGCFCMQLFSRLVLDLVHSQAD